MDTAFVFTFEGVQPVVQQSTFCPTGSEALRSQTWLRKIDARSCVEWLITDYIDAISCVDFAKPCLASQSSWARRANCGLLHYWLDAFIYNRCTGLIHRFRMREGYLFAIYQKLFVPDPKGGVHFTQSGKSVSLIWSGRRGLVGGIPERAKSAKFLYA